MLYNSENQTLINVITPGTELSCEDIEKVAGLKGQNIEQGPISEVAFVFLNSEEAEPFLPDIQKLGIECRVVIDGMEKTIIEGVKQQSVLSNQGILIPALRSSDWDQASNAIHRKLFNTPNADGPIVTFGFATSASVQILSNDGKYDQALPEIEKNALANLEKFELKISEHDKDFLSVNGDYAVEAVILLPDISKMLEKKLGCKNGGIAVAAASAGSTLVTSAEDIESTQALALWTQKKYQETGGRKICPNPIIIQNGIPIGYASLNSITNEIKAPIASKKPWWKFW